MSATMNWWLSILYCSVIYSPWLVCKYYPPGLLQHITKVYIHVHVNSPAISGISCQCQAISSITVYIQKYTVYPFSMIFFLEIFIRSLWSSFISNQQWPDSKCVSGYELHVCVSNASRYLELSPHIRNKEMNWWPSFIARGTVWPR